LSPAFLLLIEKRPYPILPDIASQLLPFRNRL